MSDAKKNGHKCGMTGKRRFKSHSHAVNRAMGIMADNAEAPKQLRAYLCQYCNGWHLTKNHENTL